MAAAPFSRLQLAAALLEYDNDPTDPEAPYRSAHESALFVHLRRFQDPRSTGATAAGQSEGRKSTDYLGVSVPSESGSGTRRSRSSINALRNPFGAPDEDEEEEIEHIGGDVEVDLSSWGLDALISKDKDKGKAKAKARSEILPNPHPELARGPNVIMDSHRSRGGRAMSVGALSDFGVGGAFLDSEEQKGSGRSSANLEHVDAQRPEHRRRASSHALIDSLPVTPPLHAVPFPSGSVRSLSPGPEEGLRPSSRSSRLDLQTNRARSYSSGNLEMGEAPPNKHGDDSDPYGVRSSSRSRPQHQGRTTSIATMGSMNSRDLITGAGEAEGNPFAVRPPSPSRSSRFDPKARARTMSNATMGTMASRDLLANEDTFAIRPPSPSRSSRFDPKVRDRTMSIASMGTRALLDNDVDGQSRFERPLSNVELLRPKVLVMPSPLQQVQPVAGPRPPSPPKARPGFQLSSSGPPVPDQARSGKRSSTYMSTYASNKFVPSSANPFTPNPRATLTLSQLAFRNTLMVGGKRDVAYADIDRVLPRATEEGEQATFDYPEEELEPELEPEFRPQLSALGSEEEVRRPAGKLYGRSLIDNLEDKKANMKSKNRVFTGDDRPSMMARGQLRRTETFIDPTSLGKLPSNVNGMANKASLLHPGQAPGARPYVSASRSVFGVDTVWERELEKLKEMEAQERLNAEEAERRAAEEAGRKKKKKKGKDKLKAVEEPVIPTVETPSIVPEEEQVAEPRVSEAPPVLPVISKPLLSGSPPVDDDDETASEASDDDAPRERGASERAADRWVANSSDEDEDGPRKTTGVGLRYPSKRRPSHAQPAAADDSDEDLPLAAAAQRITMKPVLAPDSDEEDKPLASVLDKVKLGLPSIDFDNLSRTKSADAEDDDKPLGLRMSHVPPSASAGAGGDDDQPLAFHPEQQRRTVFMQAQQQQQQQQQLMMQQQWQNSVFFGGPQMMASGFFAPPMASPMMMAPPAPMPSPPPIQDPTKFGRVDKWRRDVAVEGSEV